MTNVYQSYSADESPLRNAPARRAGNETSNAPLPRAPVSAARGSVVLSVAFIVVGLGNYAFTLSLAHLLAPSAFGVASLVQSFLLFGSWLIGAGVPWSVARHVSVLTDRREQRAVLTGALAGNFALAMGLATLLLVCLATGVLKLGDQSAVPVLLGAAACGTIGLNTAAKGGLQGLLRLTTVATANFIEVGVKLAVGLVLAALGWGATGAVVGVLAGLAAATAFTLGATWRHHLLTFGAYGGWRFSLNFYRETLGMFGAMGGLAVLTSLDVFAVKVLSPAAISNSNLAYYQVAVTLARVPYFFGSAIAAAVFPHIARNQADRVACAMYLRKALLYLTTFLTPVGLTFLIAPRSALSIFFPSSYLAAAPVLQVLSIGGVALAALAVLIGSLQAVQLAKTAAVGAALAITVELGLLGVVIPVSLTSGRQALLVATASVFDTVIVTLVCMLLVVARRQFFHWDARPRAAVGLLLSALAFSLIFGMLPHDEPVQLAAAVAISAAIYGALLVPLGVLSRGDLAALWSGVALRRSEPVRA